MPVRQQTPPPASLEAAIRWIEPDRGRSRSRPPSVTISKAGLQLSVPATRLLAGNQKGPLHLRVGVVGRRLCIVVVPEGTQGAWRAKVHQNGFLRIGGGALLDALAEHGFGPGKYEARLDRPGRLVVERPAEVQEQPDERRGALARAIGLED